MMEEGTTQEKYGDRREYSRDDSREYSRQYSGDVIALENVEPKKKKGTLCKSGSRGGRFGKFTKSRDIISIKNFLKKIVYKQSLIEA